MADAHESKLEFGSGMIKAGEGPPDIEMPDIDESQDAVTPTESKLEFGSDMIKAGEGPPDIERVQKGR